MLGCFVSQRIAVGYRFGRSHGVPQGWCAVIAALLLACCLPAPAHAQQQRQGRVRQFPVQAPRRIAQPRPPAALIETSAPISNLFSRAEEGVARGDWKFAIDCLQRIIDDPQASLVARSVGSVA